MNTWRAAMNAVSTAPLPTMKWYDVLREVLLHPTENTFTRILDDPAASSKRAFIWVAVYGLVYGFINAAVNTETTPLVWLTLIYSPVMAVVGLTISAFLLHLIAGRYGGQGTFNRMVYAIGTIEVTYGLLFSILATIFGTVLISLGMVAVLVELAFGLFSIYLTAQAIKAVEQFSISKAYWTLILLILLGGVLAACLIVLLALLGPALGSAVSP
jgi:hypothetical protein